MYIVYQKLFTVCHDCRSKKSASECKRRILYMSASTMYICAEDYAKVV